MHFHNMKATLRAPEQAITLGRGCCQWHSVFFDFQRTVTPDRYENAD